MADPPPTSPDEPGSTADIFIPWTRRRWLQLAMRPFVQAYRRLDRLVQTTALARLPYRFLKKLLGMPFRLLRLLRSQKSHYRFRFADYRMYLYGRSVFDAVRFTPACSEHEGLDEYSIDGRVVYWPTASPASDLAHSWHEVAAPERLNPLCYEFDDFGIAAGDHVLDVGACEGFFAHRALQAGAEAVHLLEPVDLLGRCLELSFAEELGDGRASLHPVLLGSSEAEVPLAVDPEFLAGSKQGSDENSQLCRRVPLDLLTEEAGIERVDFIKMDVEGDEVEAVRGARRTIEEHRPKLSIAVYHGHHNASQIEQLLQEWVPEYRIRMRGLFQYNTLPARPCVLAAEVPSA